MKIISQVNQSPTTQMNFLRDGNLICHYQDFPEVFDSLQKTIKERGVTKENNICLEIENSLTSAIALLFLLEKGYSFLLLPKPQKKSSPINYEQFIPSFCRYKLTTENLTNNDKEINLIDPDKYLQIEENPEWINNKSKISDTQPKLYIKLLAVQESPK